MAKLILVRHGQSTWNLENRFTGWVDVPLTPKGEQEASAVGEKLKEIHFKPDVIYTSELQRAHMTLEALSKVAGYKNIPVVKDKALNERHYGDLQGLNKAETAQKFGDEQVHIWRRSYDIAPPNGESLKDTAARTIPYFEKTILEDLKSGKDVLVVAHGNSLRSIIMDVEKLTPEQILKRELGTGDLVVYETQAGGALKLVK
jgi:2,3-bisphosphoglycerate-dependent phosphoglycerate mutase